jgi:hypothetical protein
MPRINVWRARARSVRIEDEIARRGISLKVVGAERIGPCPVCGGDDRFSINVTKQVFNCRGCAVGGDVIKLVEHLDRVSFTAACETLAGVSPASVSRPIKANGHANTPTTAATVAQENVVATFPYPDEAGNMEFAVERIEFWNRDDTPVLKDGKKKKTFKQKRPDPDRPGEWIYNVAGCRVLPYRLPQLIEAIANDHPIYIVEGEAKADLLAGWNVAATCNAGGASNWKSEHSAFLKDADVIIIPDADDAGVKHVQEAGASLNGIAKRIRVLMLPSLPPKGDIIDWAKAGGTREELDALIEHAPPWVPLEKPETTTAAKEREGELIAALADMEPGIEFARARKAAAEELKVNVGDIDEEVRRHGEESAAPLYGHWITEPWPEPVEGDSLLRDIIRRLKRHVVFRSPDDDPLAIALWIMFSWVHDEVAVHSPILVVTSAEPESGKTTTLGLMAFLMPRCLATVEISDAALYRSIKRWQPSFAIDEFDSVLSGDDRKGLRTVINSGHTRAQCVVRCEGDDKIPEPFETFAPKALGMIGRDLPPATASRGIFIQQERRRSDEPIEKFAHKDDPGLADPRARLFRWALDNADRLRDANPVMPEGFDNRRADNWRVQLATAELAGEDWAERTRIAAATLDRESDASTIGARLLADIRRVRDEYGGDCISSATLVAKLKEDPEAPWAEWNRGKGLTQNSLASLLGGGGGRGRRGKRGYGIHSQTVHPPGERDAKGYKWSQFEDAWSRYLTPSADKGGVSARE